MDNLVVDQRPPETTARSGLRSREIEEGDLLPVSELLGSGLGFDGRYYLQLLERLTRHRTPAGYPKYGYLLEKDGVPVGAILLIFSDILSGFLSTVRCHVTSWYVQPGFRSYAALFYSRALKHKNVVYINISAKPAAQPIVAAQGFVKYSRGQFIAIPALHLAPRKSRVRIVGARMLPDAQFEPFERDLLLTHSDYGCFSLWCVTPERASPFVFRSHLIKGALPGVQLIYCRSIDDLVEFAGPIGRYLAVRGKFVIRVDANAPVPGLIGRYFDGLDPRWFKGFSQPRLGDLAYTQIAMCGRPSDLF